MSLYLDPDKDQTSDGPLYELPDHLRTNSQSMHAAAVVLGRFGILLRGPTGSGKSVLQRHLRQQLQTKGQYSALISDDYVQLARAPVKQQDPKQNPNQNDLADAPPLLAFAPVATSRLEEVRGLGVIANSAEQSVRFAVIHLLVDLIDAEQMQRMPAKEVCSCDCLGLPVARQMTPQRSILAASDLIFARLSTLKDGR